MNLELTLFQFQIPILLFFLGIEALLSAYLHTKSYHLKDTANSVFLTGLNFLLDIAMKGVNISILFFCYQFAFYKISNAYLYWAALVVMEDFMYYALHYVDHHCRLFWAVHVTHHSSEKMNLSIGFRSSVFQPLYRVVYFIPLALLGFNPLHIALVYAITQFWGIFVHTEFIGKLGLLEYVLVTPSHHRVHHASNVAYLDKNMGMLLIVWDRIFGTFQKELPGEKPVYGLTTPIASYHPMNIIFYEWKNIFTDLKQPLSWKNKFKYLFAPPGWSHDGSKLTTKKLRQLK